MTGEAADDGPRLRVPDRLVIEGGNRLVGTVDIPGAKNAALPMIAVILIAVIWLVVSKPLALTGQKLEPSLPKID